MSYGVKKKKQTYRNKLQLHQLSVSFQEGMEHFE